MEFEGKYTEANNRVFKYFLKFRALFKDHGRLQGEKVTESSHLWIQNIFDSTEYDKEMCLSSSCSS